MNIFVHTDIVSTQTADSVMLSGTHTGKTSPDVTCGSVTTVNILSSIHYIFWETQILGVHLSELMVGKVKTDDNLSPTNGLS